TSTSTARIHTTTRIIITKTATTCAITAKRTPNRRRRKPRPEQTDGSTAGATVRTRPTSRVSALGASRSAAKRHWLTDGRLAGKCRAFVLSRKVRGTKALSIREIIRVIEPVRSHRRRPFQRESDSNAAQALSANRVRLQ